MASNVKVSSVGANAEADAIARLLDAGILRLYSGTQAAGADTAIGAQVLLAELTLNATSAPAASAGVLTFNAITSDSSADATGTATWFRALKSDGTTAVLDGTVGTASADLIMNTTSLVAAAAVAVTSMVVTVSKG